MVNPEDHALVVRSGTVDRAWYNSTYPDVALSGTDPLTHYLDTGWSEGRDPGPGFSTSFYLHENPEIRGLEINPLVHYLTVGWRDGRQPRRGFTRPALCRMLPDTCPLVVETLLGDDPDVTSEAESPWHGAQPSDVWPDVSSQKEAPAAEPPAVSPVRTVAFYLPQFHTIPENDRWWQTGFTEWVNVRRGRPVYQGHHQPHIPGDLGYYTLPGPEYTPTHSEGSPVESDGSRGPDTDDLRGSDPNETMRNQVIAAKSHGISAFCFYTYWFAGKRLLESPVEAWLSDRSLDLEFCICWANENWTRSWDGKGNRVLIGQRHSPEDDVEFIADVSRYLRDPRYLRVSGKPLLVLYRPSLLPDPRQTADRWRKWCRENDVGEIVLAYVQSFEKHDPDFYGFDYAIEFPPNLTGPVDITTQVATDPNFQGAILDGRELALRRSRTPAPNYHFWRGSCPSWDNEARRPSKGMVLANLTPADFRHWTTIIGRDTLSRFTDPSERLVFINAWNEWAEGSHLEPDRRHGYEWLHAVRDAQEALADIGPGTGPGVIVVAHDLHRNGAQMGALALAKALRDLHRRVMVVALGDGPLRREFESVVDLTLVDDSDAESMKNLARWLVGRGYTTALCNSSVTGYFAAALVDAGVRVTGLVHELPSVLDDPARSPRAEALAGSVQRLVFPNLKVKDSFPHELPETTRVVIHPQGLYKRFPSPTRESRQKLRSFLKLPLDARVVLAVGYADYRKGPDLLVRAVEELNSGSAAGRIHTVWIGDVASSDERVRTALEQAGGANLHLPGFVRDPALFYAGADVLAVPSREDPFPSVALEGLQAGLPVVAFRDRTGLDGLITETNGVLVDVVAPAALAGGLEEALLVTGPAERGLRQDYVREHFNYREYVLDLLQGTAAEISRVSVVVPNYNCGELIEARLRQILDQDFPIYELIVLDDASTDDSVSRIRATLGHVDDVAWQLHVNTKNSGSAHRQWAKGAELATGDLIWIAEAGDIAEPGFLAEVVPIFKKAPATVLSYCESKQIDDSGAELAPDYLDWTDFGQRDYTRRYLKDGRVEVAECLSVKNTIPSVSATVMRADVLREALRRAADQSTRLPTAADWWVYIQVLMDGLVAFTPATLNGHRRPVESQIVPDSGGNGLQEIAFVQHAAASAVTPSEETATAAEMFRAEIGEQVGVDGEV